MFPEKTALEKLYDDYRRQHSTGYPAEDYIDAVKQANGEYSGSSVHNTASALLM